MESGWDVWVWLVGMVSRKRVWLVGGNLWVWLECIGVASEWCCKEVYTYPHNNYYFSLLHLY